MLNCLSVGGTPRKGERRGGCLAVQQSAGSEDVFAAAGTYGAGHTMPRQVVAHPQHSLLRSTVEGRVGNLVEANQVDAALQRREQAHQLASMAFRVVQAAEDDVLEAEPPLVTPVLFPHQCQQLLQAISLLGRHHLQAFLGEGVMEAYCEVAVALSQEAFHAFPYAYRRHGDALRTSVSRCVALSTASRLSNGSPCPMKTMFVSLSLPGTE